MYCQPKKSDVLAEPSCHLLGLNQNSMACSAPSRARIAENLAHQAKQWSFFLTRPLQNKIRNLTSLTKVVSFFRTYK